VDQTLAATPVKLHLKIKFSCQKQGCGVGCKISAPFQNFRLSPPTPTFQNFRLGSLPNFRLPTPHP